MKATYTSRTDELLRKWNAEGVTVPEQARRLSVHRSTIQGWRNRLGISDGFPTIPDELHQQILSWGADGWPLSEIAETSGLSLRHIRLYYPEFRMDPATQGLLGGAVRRVKMRNPKVMQGL